MSVGASSPTQAVPRGKISTVRETRPNIINYYYHYYYNYLGDNALPAEEVVGVVERTFAGWTPYHLLLSGR